LLERRRRSEAALISVVATSYLLGVSTRRMERLVETLGIASLSKSQVSRMATELDETAAAFRSLRTLEGARVSSHGVNRNWEVRARASGAASHPSGSAARCTTTRVNSVEHPPGRRRRHAAASGAQLRRCRMPGSGRTASC
jgi:hypothetical protein